MATKYQEKSCSFQSIAARAGFLVALVALVGGGALTSCSSGSSNTSSTSTTNSASSNQPHSSTTNPATAHVLVATFADNGGTLTVQVHARIRVVLAGTSWTQTSSKPSVLKPTGKATIFPASTGCVSGQGCGSVTVFYQALKVGNAQVLGSRGSCQGAAATCKTGPGAFRLNVVVTKDT